MRSVSFLKAWTSPALRVKLTTVPGPILLVETSIRSFTVEEPANSVRTEQKGREKKGRTFGRAISGLDRILFDVVFAVKDRQYSRKLLDDVKVRLARAGEDLGRVLVA
jgi:hypothetical protein